MRKNQIDLICQYCNKIYNVQYYRRNNSKFCSSHCRAKYTGKFIIIKKEVREKLKQSSLKNNNKPPIYRGKDVWNFNPDLHIIEKTLCNCGCGNYVNHPKSRPKKFIWGHNRRTLAPEIRKIQIEKTIQSLRKYYDKIGRKTSLYRLLREIIEYKNWRKQIFERDNYTCQKCGDKKGGNLHPHHITRFSLLLKNFLQQYSQFSPIEDKDTLVRLAITYQPFWDINNGITLCKNCHKKTDTYGNLQRISIVERSINQYGI